MPVPKGGEGASGSPSTPLGDWRVMNVQRVVVATSVSCRNSGDYWSVSQIVTYCESTIGGGRMDREFTNYDDLTLVEARDVMEMIVSGPLPGQPFELRSEQLSFL